MHFLGQFSLIVMVFHFFQLAYYSVYVLRKMFDLFSGYAWGKLWGTLDERKWLTRIVFLETVAGVPGMVGAMVRHLRSLRHMDRDHGWIHTLLGLCVCVRACVCVCACVWVCACWLYYTISNPDVDVHCSTLYLIRLRTL